MDDREGVRANHRWWEERAGMHLATPRCRGPLERLRAGLVLESFREHEVLPRALFDCCEPGGDGPWRLPESLRGHCPLAFSLRARKPA